MAYQLQNRAEIRQSIGGKTGDVIVGAATSNGLATTLIDAVRLAKGGDDEYNGREIIIYDAAGSIVDGETSVVTDFAASGTTATVAAFSTTTATGDKYEMWSPDVRILDVNRSINDAINRATAEGALKEKITATTFTERYKNEYACLTGFKSVNKVEYETSIDEYYDLHTCDTAWDESVDSDVAVSVDDTVYHEGSQCVKLVVAASASANDVIAADNITSTDISNCDTIEFWIYSTVALAASDYQLLLDDTASCASAVETLNLAAVTAKTWTRQILTLANPMSDTAIISIGLKMVTDKGAHTIYIDDIKAVRSSSRHYVTLAPDWWDIVKGTTPYLKLNAGHPVPDNTILRITGLQIPTQFSDDVTDADIDPDYIVAQASADLIQSGILGRKLDDYNRRMILKDLKSEALGKLRSIHTNTPQNTKWVEA